MSDWIKTAKVGDKVVCQRLYEGGGYGDEALPVIGETYTIRAFDVDGEVYLLLKEVKNSERSYLRVSGSCPVMNYEMSFHWTGFSPVEPRETDISWAHAILKKASKPVEEVV